MALNHRLRQDAVAQALQAVLQRPGILRSTFHWGGVEEPVDGVWRPASFLVVKGSVSPELDLV
ncbi:hypothetical protein, partial [Pseudomonas carnis]|uniref:hypothetical protein n=1 Tax=Pseudomonas carnis TaxID=2487355 RepID=UPI001F3CB28C